MLLWYHRGGGGLTCGVVQAATTMQQRHELLAVQ